MLDLFLLGTMRPDMWALQFLALIEGGQETLERCYSQPAVLWALHEQLDTGRASQVDLGCFPRKSTWQRWLQGLVLFYV